LQLGAGLERLVQRGQEAAGFLRRQGDGEFGGHGGLGFTQQRITREGRHRQPAQRGGAGDALLVPGVQAKVEAGVGGTDHGGLLCTEYYRTFAPDAIAGGRVGRPGTAAEQAPLYRSADHRSAWGKPALDFGRSLARRQTAGGQMVPPQEVRKWWVVLDSNQRPAD